jgi:hypothetical protein
MLEVDDSDFKKMLAALETNVTKAWQNSGTFFKNTTPVRSGNARSRTRTVGDNIRADYGYAGSLDAGSSRQAPGGMTNPTIDHFDKLVDNIVRKYG